MGEARRREQKHALIAASFEQLRADMTRLAAAGADSIADEMPGSRVIVIVESAPCTCHDLREVVSATSTDYAAREDVARALVRILHHVGAAVQRE